jgi:hypothetical protein
MNPKMLSSAQNLARCAMDDEGERQSFEDWVWEKHDPTRHMMHDAYVVMEMENEFWELVKEIQKKMG